MIPTGTYAFIRPMYRVYILHRGLLCTPFAHPYSGRRSIRTWRDMQSQASAECPSSCHSQASQPCLCTHPPTSHCLALKKVLGPTGGPSSGGTMMRRLPPGFMPLMPNSKPAHYECVQQERRWQW
jgi:hypothetical protein